VNSQGAGTTYRNILRLFEVEPSLPAAVEENLSCQRRNPCVRQIFGQSPRCGSGPTPVFIVFIYFFPPLVTLRPFSRNIGDVFCHITGYGIEGNTGSAGRGIWRSLSGVETGLEGLEGLETYLNVSCALDVLSWVPQQSQQPLCLSRRH